jgi:modulator of FtsH protease HflC
LKLIAEVTSKDPEFYGFYRSLEAYRKALNKDDTTMVLSPNSEFFRYFGKPTP